MSLGDELGGEWTRRRRGRTDATLAVVVALDVEAGVFVAVLHVVGHLQWRDDTHAGNEKKEGS